MFATNYRSIIAFGRASVVADEEGQRAALEGLIDKYSPGFREEGKKEIDKGLDRVCIVEMHIEHLTGKAAQRNVQKGEVDPVTDH
jgi:nitroimidazol reductase NimA-like FMN-containing flavoprotein (pyridoxamine 5'-phosphate oxidase superfamily)